MLTYIHTFTFRALSKLKAAKKVASDLAENKEMTEKQKLKVPQIHTYIHTCIHTYIYMYTYIYSHSII